LQFLPRKILNSLIERDLAVEFGPLGPSKSTLTALECPHLMNNDKEKQINRSSSFLSGCSEDHDYSFLRLKDEANFLFGWGFVLHR
jgi:hypothetical protein